MVGTVKQLSGLIVLVVVMAACGGALRTLPLEPAAIDAAIAADQVAPTPAPSPTPTETPAAPLYSKLRAFVASESTDQVWVLEGAPGQPYALVTKIPVGRFPHQIAVSPDGKWVAVNDRLGNVTSIIDPIAMKEVVRIGVGKQPHGITFSPDGKTLYVAHERDVYIQPIEVGTWKPLPALFVGVSQHVITMNAARPNELWFTVTNSNENDHLRVVDVVTRQITKVKVNDVHDAYFTPDGSEMWSSSSGFLDKPSDRMVIYDPVTKTVKQEIHLTGHYPFHTLKAFQDGMYYPADTSVMILSDHTAPGLLWVDWRERKILGETKFDGQQPFHSTYDPEGDRLLVTTNVDGMVNVIDMKTRAVIQKVPVTKAHGIVSVGIP